MSERDTLRGTSSPKWQIHGRFLIVGEDEDEAYKALEALEGAGTRATASVTINVHLSEEGRADGE